MRLIPVALAEHLEEPATTTCMLLRVELRDGTVFGLAALDRDVIYNDGRGQVTYSATNGFDPSTVAADAAYAVDNAEGYALLAGDVPGVTAQMVEAGELDDAQWTVLLVDYEDLSRGHVVLDAGDAGEVTVRHGMVWMPELLSYAMRLRQPVGHVWQRSCRAIFGSDPDSQTGCGVDAQALWADGQVTVVGGETDRTFTGDLIASSNWPTDPFPGRLEWLSGDNVGRQYSLEAFDADSDGGHVVLAEPMPYPIQAGDSYRLRPDCGKRFTEDCVATWNNGQNFKGEPFIPVGDSTAIQTPGAQLPEGFMGAVARAVTAV